MKAYRNFCQSKCVFDVLRKKTNKMNILLRRDLGSISSTYLRTAFTPAAPKSLRIQSICQCLFTLLRSTGAKAARRMLMKLTTGRYSEVVVTQV